METTIIVDNLKCDGCAGTIRKELSALPGVLKVNADPEENSVIIEYNDFANMETIKTILKSLGYPEAGTLHGFDKFATNTKSYVSCAIGKMTKDKH